jgi:hypothetical protein
LDARTVTLALFGPRTERKQLARLSTFDIGNAPFDKSYGCAYVDSRSLPRMTETEYVNKTLDGGVERARYFLVL